VRRYDSLCPGERVPGDSCHFGHVTISAYGPVSALIFYLLMLQIEADLLKSIMSGSARTKVVALGIGDQVDQYELRDIASSPHDRNVILVQDFSSLPLVEEQLRNESCRGMVRPVKRIDKAFSLAFRCLTK